MKHPRNGKGLPKKRWFVLTKSHLHYADEEGLQPKMKWDLKDARVGKKNAVSALPVCIVVRASMGAPTPICTRVHTTSPLRAHHAHVIDHHQTSIRLELKSGFLDLGCGSSENAGAWCVI